MAAPTCDIVQKLWNLCNVLHDDGVAYQQYVTELVFLLLLKMAKETGGGRPSSRRATVGATSAAATVSSR